MIPELCEVAIFFLSYLFFICTCVMISELRESPTIFLFILFFWYFLLCDLLCDP